MLNTVQMQFAPINAAANGPSSSSDLNTMTNAISSDLVTVIGVINNTLVPMLATIPDGTIDAEVNAWTNGLDSKTLYVDNTATSSYNPSYFLAVKSRPITIYECILSIQSNISDMQQALLTEISNLTATSSSVSITDVGNYYKANGNYDVEAALQAIGAYMASHP